MTVNINQTLLNPTHIRILHAREWSTNFDDFVELPYWNQDTGGYKLSFCEQVALPATGEALITFDFGRFLVSGGQQIVGAPSLEGGGWDYETNTVEIEDITGHIIIIQATEAAANREDIVDSDWRAIYMGGVDYYRDMYSPGDTIPMGSRDYYLTDLWTFFSRHWYNTSYTYRSPDGTQDIARAKGAPRYNAQDDGTGYVLGNKLASGSYTPTWAASSAEAVTAHTVNGATAATKWTDAEAIQHQINSCRGPASPWFEFIDSISSGSATLFDGSEVWIIEEDDSVFDVVNEICDRRRGRGLVAFEWSIDGGIITTMLRAYPQTLDSVSYSDPSDASSIVIPGADLNATSRDYDLIGDHRNVDELFSLGQRHLVKVDYLETVGEPIEMLTTLSYEGTAIEDEATPAATATLVKGWTSARATSYEAASEEERKSAEWDEVYTTHRLKRNWDGLAGDGKGGETGPIYFSCQDDGSLKAGTDADDWMGSGSLVDVAPDRIQIMRDLPLLEGYDYTTSSVVRYDSADLDSVPMRRPALAMIRDQDAASDAWLDVTSLNLTPVMRIYTDGISLQFATDRQNSVRAVSDTTASLGASFDYTDLAFTVSLKMPHRIRMATKDPNSAVARRMRRIYIPGLYLHLAHYQAIWDIDYTVGAEVGLRSCAGATSTAPGIIRDDRSELARIHNLAWTWYGQDRQNVTWATRACGLLGSYESYTANEGADTVTPIDEPGNPSDVAPLPDSDPVPVTITYPIVGEVITVLRASGLSHPINSPITRVRYDHENGITSWSADWVELDFRRV